MLLTPDKINTVSTVLPGLIDCHTHLGADSQDASRRRVGAESEVTADFQDEPQRHETIGRDEPVGRGRTVLGERLAQQSSGAQGEDCWDWAWGDCKADRVRIHLP